MTVNEYGVNEQALEALELANRVRIGRAVIKKEIRKGETTVIDVIECQPYVCDNMTVSELLSCQKRWQERRVEKMLSRRRVSLIHPWTKLGNLTKRQREILVRELKYLQPPS